LNKRHTISIDYEVYTRLVEQGKFGESFTELISRLLDDLDSNDEVDK
jgi:predicted CopG family antitoxin